MPDNQRPDRNQVENSGAVDSGDDATREKNAAKEFQNVRSQIEFLQALNRELLTAEKASRKALHNLQIEQEDYQRYMFQPGGIGELKKNYEYEMTEMETKIIAQNSVIAEGKQIIQNVYDQKMQMAKDIENVAAALREKQRLRIAEKTGPSLENMQAELGKALGQRQELEKLVHDSQLAIGVRLESEQRVLQNVREAISMAGDAIAEKEAAQKRQQVMEKECDSLATNIGQIIDKATRNAEIEMEDSRKKFKERQLILLDEQLKLQEQIQNQIEFNQVLQVRCNHLLQISKSASQQIENLNLQLQSAARDLEATEEKIEARETLVREVTLLNKRIEDSEKELQRCKQTNLQEKEKYKKSRKVITKQFEDQMHLLRTKNNNLKADKHY